MKIQEYNPENTKRELNVRAIRHLLHSLKMNFFSLLIGIVVVYIIYSVIRWRLIHIDALSKITLFLIPAAFLTVGRLLDYKRTIKDNAKIAKEQNNSIIESVNNLEKSNEELQIKIEERTQELKTSNEKLQETLINLRRSEGELLFSEKMTGVGHLAAGVAHEINNPMGAVRNYMQLILEDLSEDDERKKILLEADSDTQESKILINDLLSFSRTNENLFIVDIDINETIEKIIAKKKNTFLSQNIKINKDLAPDIPSIKSDAMQIDQMFTNIIMNACNAIKENGEIFIKTSHNSDEVHVDIRDNGKIIPQESISKIFDPYGSAHNATGRKDLGLAISYNIVKRFNGDIKITSTVESGTKFNVVIPYNINK